MGTQRAPLRAATRDLMVLAAVVPAAGCLSCDAYQTRLLELSGVLVHVTDARGLPVEVAVRHGDEATVTDPAGLAWIRTGGASTVVSVQPPGTAPMALEVSSFHGFTGATLELVPLAQETLLDGSGTINEAGVRSLAFAAGTLEATGDVVVPYAWGDGNAPPSGAIDVLRAVYLGNPCAEDAPCTGTESEPSAPFAPGASAVWRVQGVPELRDRRELNLYRFDEATAAWVLQPGQLARPATTWLEARLAAPGAWYALGAPPTATCAHVRVVDAESSRAIPGAELRVEWADRGGAARAVTDEEGRACLAGADASVSVGVLRGIDGEPRRVWSEAVSLGATLEVRSAADEDGDGWPAGAGWDCRDGDPASHPGATDVPADGVDQDCDGLPDQVDADHDGDPAGADCDDADPDQAHGLPEVCDQVDNDCDGQADDELTDRAVERVIGECLSCGPRAIAALRPVFYFPLDDIDDQNTADFSGWGRDLTVAGGRSLSEGWPGIADWSGDVPYWTGDVSQFLWLVDRDFAWPTDEMTVSVWIRNEFPNRTVLSYVPPYVVEETATTSERYPGCDPDFLGVQDLDLNTKLSRTQVQTSGVEVQLSGAAAPREWTHLVFVRDGSSTGNGSSTGKLYVNGKTAEADILSGDYTCAAPPKEDGTANPPVSGLTPLPMTPGGVLRLGQSMDSVPDQSQDLFDPLNGENRGTRAFEGVMDEIAIFDRALSADEVARLFDATTCGEGLLCDGSDDDHESPDLFDDHLVGTEACPAVPEGAVNGCEVIERTGSAMGVGPYYLDLGGPEPQKVWCSDGQPSWCGDGVRSTLDEVAAQESCDPADVGTWPLGALGCSADCVSDMRHLRDCQEIADAVRAQDPAAVVPDGAYLVDVDGPLGRYPPVPVRCDMDLTGEAWTQIVRHDSRAGVLFLDPGDPGARAQCPAVEDCDNGSEDPDIGARKDADPDLDGSTSLMDCLDPECATSPSCGPPGVTEASPWAPENLLCTGPNPSKYHASELPLQSCFCACPTKNAPADNTSCIGPLNAKYSMALYLDAFQDEEALVQYRLRWPFHEVAADAEFVQWCQTWLPTVDGRDGGWWGANWDPVLESTLDGFAGLAPHPRDPGCYDPTYGFAAFDGVVENYTLYPPHNTCDERFSVGLFRGNGAQTNYGIPSNSGHFPDATSKTVELWARRVTDAATQCPGWSQ